MKHVGLLAGGILFVAAFAIGWKASRAARDTEAALEVVNRKASSVEEEMQRAEARIAAAEQERARLRAQLERVKQAKTVSTGARPAAASASQPSGAAGNISREETKEALARLEYDARERVRFASVYQPLFAELRLSRAQIDQFIAIGMKRWERMNDLNTQTIVARDNAGLERLRQQAEAEEEAAYRMLLGDAAYHRLHDYDRSVMARYMIADLAADAALAGISVDASRLEAIVEVIASNSHTLGRGNYFAYWKTLAADWSIVDPQVRALMPDALWRLYHAKISGRSDYKFETALRQAVDADAAAAQAQTRDGTVR